MSKPDLETFLEDLPEVHSEITGTRRSYNYEYRVAGPDADGAFWGATLMTSDNEGIDRSSYDIFEVVSQETTIIEWVKKVTGEG